MEIKFIMTISKVHQEFSTVLYAQRQNKLGEKIYKVARDALVYLVNNRYSLTLSCWSYLLIECVVTAGTSITTSNYVYNVETCRNMLCEYSNNYTVLSGSYLPSYDVTCNMTLEEMPYYSFLDCMDDLCRYTNRIGEKFYACTGTVPVDNEPEYSYLNVNEPAFDYWRQICPKRHFAHLSKVKQLQYLTRCIQKMCRLNDTISNFGREVLELCSNSPLDKLDEILHEMYRSINRLRDSLDSTDSLASTNMITGIVASVTSVLSGIATIVGIIIMHRIEPRTQVNPPLSPALTQGIENIGGVVFSESSSLARGIANIAHSGIQTTSSLLSETVNQFEHLLPDGSVNLLRELTQYSHSSVKNIEELIEIIETTL